MNKSFEEQMEKLEQIVEELEKGNLNLDEKKITILVNKDGEVSEEEFEAK